MNQHETSVLVSDLVAERPSRSRLFEQLGIEYCCGGNRPLDEVCRERGLDARTLLDTLRAAETEGIGAGQEKNWTTASIEELIADIINVHHASLRRELPRLAGLALRVVDSHGDREPRLHEVRECLNEFTAEMEPHLDSEEKDIFRRILDLTDPHGVSDPRMKSEAQDEKAKLISAIEHLERDHRTTAERLSRIESLTDRFQPPEWACNSFRAFYDGLRELTADIHQHVHKENNLLFPAVLKTLGT